jgi:hypothetical protein
MVTTLGDLRRESKARVGTLSTEAPRQQTLARPDAADLHSPHEVVGLLVAQALDWDTKLIVEAFTIALKQASVQGSRTKIDGSEAEADLPGNFADTRAQSVPALEHARLTPDTVPEGEQAPTGSADRVAAQSVLTEQFAPTQDDGRTPAISEVRQQFITLGELVLEAIGAVDRTGGEAVS